MANSTSIQLVGRRVRLRPVTASDVQALHREELSNPEAIAVRYRGRTPSLATYEQALFAGVEACYLIVRAESPNDAPLGLASLHQCNYRSGYGYIGAWRIGESDTAGRLPEGLILFLNVAFSIHPFRHIYMETIEPTLSHLSSEVGGGPDQLFEEVGRFPDREFYAGAYHDMVLLQLTHERWKSQSPSLLRWAIGEVPGV